MAGGLWWCGSKLKCKGKPAQVRLRCLKISIYYLRLYFIRMWQPSFATDSNLIFRALKVGAVSSAFEFVSDLSVLESYWHSTLFDRLCIAYTTTTVLSLMLNKSKFMLKRPSNQYCRHLYTSRVWMTQRTASHGVTI